MKYMQTYFFALKDDFSKILCEFEEENNIRYIKSGLFDNSNVSVIDSVSKIIKFGTVTYGDWNKIDDYLIFKNGISIKVERTPQLSGGVKFAINQYLNPDTVCLKFGGIFQNDKIIIPGRLGTISENSTSQKLYKFLSSKIKRKFQRIGNFYVGELAEIKLKEGWRLTTNIKLHKGFDLLPL